ncbi:hypothetical protein OG535_35645 [Kitasatospora sp. NBC_00085]|uniref:hypothetical protein n=1 Tax=unclassified Kitasatospora TaxID=2633591 RepID=UPI0032484BE0
MDFTEELAVLATTGKLGALSYGATLPGLAAAHGAPVTGGRVYEQSRWPRWFRYGSVQLVVCRCRRLDSMIIPAWHEELELPGPRPGDLRTVDSRVTESELTAALVRAGCRWETVEYENLTDQRSLQTGPDDDVRVSFTFVSRESYDSPLLEDWILDKVNLWGLSHGECPEPDRP